MAVHIVRLRDFPLRIFHTNVNVSQLAKTIQADIGQMPSSRYRHIGPMRVADLRPSGFAPWANVDSTSAQHRQTQQPSIGPMMGRCLVVLNRSDAGSTLACHRETHQPSISPMMGSCPFLHHWLECCFHVGKLISLVSAR